MKHRKEKRKSRLPKTQSSKGLGGHHFKSQGLYPLTSDRSSISIFEPVQAWKPNLKTYKPPKKIIPRGGGFVMPFSTKKINIWEQSVSIPQRSLIHNRANAEQQRLANLTAEYNALAQNVRLMNNPESVEVLNDLRRALEEGQADLARMQSLAGQTRMEAAIGMYELNRHRHTLSRDLKSAIDGLQGLAPVGYDRNILAGGGVEQDFATEGEILQAQSRLRERALNQFPDQGMQRARHRKVTGMRIGNRDHPLGRMIPPARPLPDVAGDLPEPVVRAQDFPLPEGAHQPTQVAGAGERDRPLSRMIAPQRPRADVLGDLPEPNIRRQADIPPPEREHQPTRVAGAGEPDRPPPPRPRVDEYGLAPPREQGDLYWEALRQHDQPQLLPEPLPDSLVLPSNPSLNPIPSGGSLVQPLPAPPPYSELASLEGSPAEPTRPTAPTPSQWQESGWEVFDPEAGIPPPAVTQAIIPQHLQHRYRELPNQAARMMSIYQNQDQHSILPSYSTAVPPEYPRPHPDHFSQPHQTDPVPEPSQPIPPFEPVEGIEPYPPPVGRPTRPRRQPPQQPPQQPIEASSQPIALAQQAVADGGSAQAELVGGGLPAAGLLPQEEALRQIPQLVAYERYHRIPTGGSRQARASLKVLYNDAIRAYAVATQQRHELVGGKPSDALKHDFNGFMDNWTGRFGEGSGGSGRS